MVIRELVTTCVVPGTGVTGPSNFVPAGKFIVTKVLLIDVAPRLVRRTR
jgi:hypothetical protein